MECACGHSSSFHLSCERDQEPDACRACFFVNKRSVRRVSLSGRDSYSRIVFSDLSLLVYECRLGGDDGFGEANVDNLNFRA